MKTSVVVFFLCLFAFALPARPTSIAIAATDRAAKAPPAVATDGTAANARGWSADEARDPRRVESGATSPIGVVTSTPSPIGANPEPGLLIVFGFALLAVVGYYRRRSRRV